MNKTLIKEDEEKTLIEEKKEYLKSYQKAIRREKEIIDEIQRLRTNKMFPSAVNDGMPKSSSQSDLSDYAMILDEQIQLLKEERLNQAKIYRDIENKIRNMENEDEQRVLRLRYIKGMKWEEVAVQMGYSWRRTHDIHSNALKHFEL